MPLVQTRGAASAQGFGEFAQATAVNYIEDVFSTYLYTGNGSTQTITNNIDLSTKGGLVWVKPRDGGTADHALSDTVTGRAKYLITNSAGAQGGPAGSTENITSFNSNGFSLGTDYQVNFNGTGLNTVSWTFRKQPKFFDIVTYTGNGVAGRQIAHNLGSVPGCIIVKNLELGTNWTVYHRGADASVPQDYEFYLDATNARIASLAWNNTAPTSTNFTVGSGNEVNRASSLNTYVAYIFAHDAGGFGLAGTDNVISCGTYTGTGAAGNNISLGYEPQWLLIKNSAGAFASVNNWTLYDVMRGFDNSADNILRANTSGAEIADTAHVVPTSTGFTLTTSGSGTNGSGSTYIYIAIRRGPMKVPTVGTTVYNAISRTGTGAAANITGVGFPPDFIMARRPSTAGDDNNIWDRLRGATKSMYTQGTAGESTNANTVTAFGMDGVSVGTSQPNAASYNYINWFFKRAPSVFDIVCYTGTGVATTFTHNLTVVPELMIVKKRSSANNWVVWQKDFGTGLYGLEEVYLNLDYSPPSSGGAFLNTPTSTVFSVSTYGATNGSGATYVAYLFATCAGVSKVFSYTGNGSSQTINCGFTAGSRWVMIKRTDSTGDWYVWDSTRGIVAGNDPHLSLNTTDAEVTTDDSVDTDNTGFIVNQLSATDVNVTSATYIGIAIA